MKKNKSLRLAVIISLSLIACFLCILLLIALRDNEEKNRYWLPKLEISLNGNTLEDLNDWDKSKEYSESRLVIQDYSGEKEYNNVTIKGRGNSTWVQEKKPYQIKFENKTDLLGIGKAKKWVLLANYFDPSNLRNDVAFRIEEMLNDEERHRGDFVELYINNEYLGLYYLLHKIEIDKSSVDLRDSLGVLVEMENLRREEEDCYDSFEWSCLTLKDAVREDNKEEAMVRFLESFNLLEKAAKEGDYKKIEELADIESFVRYYLLSEFTVNPDAYTTSYYFYKDGDSDKIHVGPAWDFDLAFGNKQWTWNIVSNFHSPYLTRAREPEAFGDDFIGGGEKVDRPNVAISKLIYYMLRIPEFKEKVCDAFSERMSGRKEELLFWLGGEIERINIAAKKNEEKWGNGNYEEETKELLNWVSARFNYFESEYGYIEKNDESNINKKQKV